MAVIAIRTIHRMGLRVPEDISIIGFSSTRLSELSDPRLTTIAQPELEIGKQSIERLLELFDQDKEQETASKTYLLPSKLITRDSTGPCPKP